MSVEVNGTSFIDIYEDVTTHYQWIFSTIEDHEKKNLEGISKIRKLFLASRASNTSETYLIWISWIIIVLDFFWWYNSQNTLILLILPASVFFSEAENYKYSLIHRKNLLIPPVVYEYYLIHRKRTFYGIHDYV